MPPVTPVTPTQSAPVSSSTTVTASAQESTPSSNTPSTPPKRKFPTRMMVGAFVVFLLVIGAVSVLYLTTETKQDVRNQASVKPPGDGSNPYVTWVPTPTPDPSKCQVLSGCRKPAYLR